jgi:hypothetical protein
VIAAAALTAACTSAPSVTLEYHARAESASLPALDVRLQLQSEHQRDGDRYLRAVAATLKTSSEWLGELPRAPLTLIDPPWRSAAAESLPGALILDRTPWLSAPTSMTPELAVARAISRHLWRQRIDAAALPTWFVDGLAEYMARRAVAGLFAADNTGPGYAFLEDRYFGGFVPRFVRIRMLPETDGSPVPEYRARPGVAIVDRPTSAVDARRLTGKSLLMLGTLERWVGRPVFDQLIAEFARLPRSAPPTLADFTRTATDVSGQDLRWLFDEALGSPGVFDYGMESLTSEPEAGGTFVTTLVARRYGDARFTGSSAPPITGFENGRGISVQVAFADGRRRIDYWDGRSPSQVFRYRSGSKAVAADVDPDRTLLLDLKPTNNSVTLNPVTSVAASRWAARWMAWLEHALLTYGALV